MAIDRQYVISQSGGVTLVDLGTGTSFDVKALAPSVDYATLTNDNFLTSSVTDASSRKIGVLTPGCSSSSAATTSGIDNSLKQIKSYSSDTGILSFSIYSSAYTYSNCGSGTASNTSSVHAYLVY